MVVYVILTYANGSFFGGQEPDVAGVFTHLIDAQKCFKKKVDEWKEYCSPDSEIGEYANFFEVTDFENDFYANVRMVVTDLTYCDEDTLED